MGVAAPGVGMAGVVPSLVVGAGVGDVEVVGPEVWAERGGGSVVRIGDCVWLCAGGDGSEKDGGSSAVPE